MGKTQTPKSKMSMLLKPGETTKRRKQKPPSIGSLMAGPSVVSEGEMPEDVLVNISTGRKPSFDLIPNQHRNVSKMFLENCDKIPRIPIPINEAERVKLDRDEVFFSGQYCKLYESDYTIVQAPTKQNQKELWRYVWVETISIIVCLCHEEQMSDNSDDKKCYQYFPTEENESHVVDYGTGKMNINCTKKESLSCGAIKYSLEMTSQGIDPDEKQEVDDCPDAEAKSKKTRQITLIHATHWTGKKEKEPFEGAHDTALLASEVFKTEMVHIRKDLVSKNSSGRVVIQSFDGIGRAAILWVALNLCRDSNKRDCFDLFFLIKRLMRLRPGCFQNYFEFCYAAAVALWIAKDMNWIKEKEFTSSLESLTTSFADRKLDENGHVI